MAREHSRHHGALSDRCRTLVRLAQSGDRLRPALLDPVRIEARRGHGQPQQLERLVAVGGQKAQRTADIVERGAEAQRNGRIFLALLEGLRIERSRTVGQQARREAGQPLLVLGIAGTAAGEGKGQRHDRRAAVLDQPRLDAERRRDLP